jgi:hypothetical protein
MKRSAEVKDAGREGDGSALPVCIQWESGDCVERGLDCGSVVGFAARGNGDASGNVWQRDTSTAISGGGEVGDAVSIKERRVDEAAVRAVMDPCGLTGEWEYEEK